MEKHICDYGCGQEAKFQFKNGKWCCSKSTAKCPTIRRKISINHANMNGLNNPMWNKHQTKEARKKQSESKFGENNPRGMLGKHHSKETRKRQSEAVSGENHPRGMLGKHHSAETRKIQSEAKKEIAKKLRTPFEEIIRFTENEGFNMLSKEADYKNQFSKLWFRCSEGHEFPARWDGFKSGNRCPECDSKKRSQKMKNGQASYMNSCIKNPSKPQMELFNLVKENHPSAILNYQILNFSIDIAIPNLKIAVEYDGSYWHQDQEKDDIRQKKIENEGWTFLRYRDYVPSKEELVLDIKNLRNFKYGKITN